MSKYQIVEANLSDPEQQRAVVRLINEYAQIPMIHGQPLQEDVRRQLIPGLQKHPTVLIFLAYDESVAVGVAICFVGFSTFAARPLINIHDLAVQQEYQARGIGRLLMQAVETKALELNCCKITLEVDENNERARHVYAAAGFGESPPREVSGRALFLTKRLK